MPKVTMIPATINPLTHLPKVAAQKRRVAGYARVSTDSDEQFTSYEAQVDYHTKFIQSKPEWDFVKVYTDEGISGCNTKKRDGFNSMVADALDGKIDLIVTKSVSRFARNTVDSLVTIRKLKENGVECYFEKEGIFTFDGKGELLITIMSSLAQEESRSISENITWGQRKSFADGKVHLAYKRFLGYEKGEDGRPTIVESEAKIVQLIYRLFLDGKSQASICRCLEDLGIPSPGGKEKWSKTTVTSILQNEKYKGDALLQKSFTVDFLEKRMKPNEGEVPQYYVEGSHPAIVDPDEWELVQAEFTRRKSLGRAYSGKSVLSAKLVCEDCGGFFGSKVWHSTDRYRRTIWQCNSKFKGEERCHTPTVETVVLLSHKKPDSVINVKVEFGEGEGTVPLDNIAKRAEAYKPKERVTYKMIKEYIEAKYGFKVHVAYIAEVKRDLGLPMYDAPNAVEELKQPRKHPTPEKVEAIKDALKYFEVI